MQLIIDTYGITLRIENNRLLMQKGETEKSIPPGHITAIHLFSGCSLTSPVVIWAAEHQIAILFYNRKGQVTARLWQPHFGSHAAIRIAQVHFFQSAEACFTVKNWLVAKATAQLRLQKSFAPHAHTQKIVAKMEQYVHLLKGDTGINLNFLRSREARISRLHWAGVALSLKNHVKMGNRNTRPAKDHFNALLNYLYGTLYGLVEGCQLAAGLDPHISFMHRMEYNTPSLVFDMIEPFRHWADHYATQLILNGQFAADFAEEKNGAIQLTTKAKKFILTGWFAYLDEKEPAPKKRIKRKDQVQQTCTQLAAVLLKYYEGIQKQS